MTETELIKRIRNAIILLQAGHPFRIGDLILRADDNRQFSVIGETVSNELQNMTMEKAKIELGEIKDLFRKMVLVSPELSGFISNREIKFSLVYNYGMGSIEICSDTAGTIKWAIDLNSKT